MNYTIGWINSISLSTLFSAFGNLRISASVAATFAVKPSLLRTSTLVMKDKRCPVMPRLCTFNAVWLSTVMFYTILRRRSKYCWESSLRTLSWDDAFCSELEILVRIRMTSVDDYESFCCASSLSSDFCKSSNTIPFLGVSDGTFITSCSVHSFRAMLLANSSAFSAMTSISCS